MAFNQTRSTTTANRSSSVSQGTSRSTGGGSTNDNELFVTGMYKPNKEGVKSIASVKLKEDLNIPAGSYVNIYVNEYKKEESHPDYKLRVTKGKQA